MVARRNAQKKGEELQDEQATIGQLTSHIQNKQVRAELYAKLKSKKKVKLHTNSAGTHLFSAG